MNIENMPVDFKKYTIKPENVKIYEVKHTKTDGSSYFTREIMTVEPAEVRGNSSKSISSVKYGVISNSPSNEDYKVSTQKMMTLINGGESIEVGLLLNNVHGDMQAGLFKLSNFNCYKTPETFDTICMWPENKKAYETAYKIAGNNCVALSFAEIKNLQKTYASFDNNARFSNELCGLDGFVDKAHKCPNLAIEEVLSSSSCDQME